MTVPITGYAESAGTLGLLVTIEGTIGDVNCDAVIDLTDVSVLYRWLLNRTGPNDYLNFSDVNGDYETNLRDVAALFNLVCA